MKYMKSTIIILLATLFLVAGCTQSATKTTQNEMKTDDKAIYKDKVVVAHRGSPGYIPEHTLAGKAYAIASGADYVEQDIVMTKDDQLIVMHDHTLERNTDVKQKFPNRHRSDGRYYVIDFTLEEIKSLQAIEAIDDKGENVYPKRFPADANVGFVIPTLAEELSFIRGLEKSTGKKIGIYPEIKNPALHRHEGKDISMAVLKMLKAYGYDSRDDKIFLQTFDFNELVRIHDELLPALGMDLPLVMLYAETSWGEVLEYQEDGTTTNYDFDWMYTTEGVAKVAKYADGIGPWYPKVIDPKSTADNIILTNLVEDAHANGMVVHPFTFRKEDVPSYAKDFKDFVTIFYNVADVDGLFTDFAPDVVQMIR